MNRSIVITYDEDRDDGTWRLYWNDGELADPRWFSSMKEASMAADPLLARAPLRILELAP